MKNNNLVESIGTVPKQNITKGYFLDINLKFGTQIFSQF